MTTARKDLIVILGIALVFFLFSYFLNIFGFLVEMFKENPRVLANIDEIITVLLVMSIGFVIFSWRRWNELKKETARRLELQDELLKNAETRAETERIINKQLRCEIEERKKISDRQSRR